MAHISRKKNSVVKMRLHSREMPGLHKGSQASGNGDAGLPMACVANGDPCCIGL
jgi:hypothetical protein